MSRLSDKKTHGHVLMELGVAAMEACSEIGVYGHLQTWLAEAKAGRRAAEVLAEDNLQLAHDWEAVANGHLAMLQECQRQVECGTKARAKLEGDLKVCRRSQTEYRETIELRHAKTELAKLNASQAEMIEERDQTIKAQASSLLASKARREYAEVAMDLVRQDVVYYQNMADNRGIGKANWKRLASDASAELTKERSTVTRYANALHVIADGGTSVFNWTCRELRNTAKDALSG